MLMLVETPVEEF